MGWGAGKVGFQAEHELHKRRRGINLGLGLALVGLVAIIFGLTVIKVQQVDPDLLKQQAGDSH